MEYKYINLTGHEVHELRSGLRIQPSGKIRVKSNTTIVRVIDGIPHECVTVSLLDNLPEPQDGVIYIVSQLTLNAIPSSRTDIIAPKQVVRHKTGPNKGEVKGCIGFRIKE